MEPGVESGVEGCTWGHSSEKDGDVGGTEDIGVRGRKEKPNVERREDLAGEGG